MFASAGLSLRYRVSVGPICSRYRSASFGGTGAVVVRAGTGDAEGADAGADGGPDAGDVSGGGPGRTGGGSEPTGGMPRGTSAGARRSELGAGGSAFGLPTDLSAVALAEAEASAAVGLPTEASAAVGATSPISTLNRPVAI